MVKEWWEFQFAEAPEASGGLLLEDLASELIASGAGGVQTTDAGILIAYAHQTTVEKARFLDNAKNLGLVLVGSRRVPDHNWVQECEELWKPLRIGSLTIRPVLNSEEIPLTAPHRDEIRLIPGLGFGTGHHPTTHTVIEVLQTSLPSQFKARSALDVGTGSGILALAVRRLWDIPVIATDIDMQALFNAADNIALNPGSCPPALVCAELTAISGHYDLIVANLYAEVLESLAPLILDRLAPRGVTILSGIAENLCGRVVERVLEVSVIRERQLECVLERAVESWSTVIFQAKN